MAYHFRGLKILLLMGSLTALVAASDDPFVGTWKLNRDKSWRGGQTAEFKDLGGDRYLWVYNSSHPFECLADGKEHPFTGGDTYSLSRESPDRLVMTNKRDGQVTSVSAWTLSDSGKQLKFESKGTRPDGSSYTSEESWTRVGSGSGLAGKWELKESQSSSVFELVIKPFENDGLSISVPADKSHQEFKFDGKDYPLKGPQVIPGTTTSATRIDQRTIHRTSKFNGKVTSTDEWVISADGRTLTDTGYAAGQKQPEILVFEKEM